jgi:prepilin-type N-terminal cleavage/methylation domain-containing protein
MLKKVAKNTQDGFTLIELLVVLGIISLISSLTLVATVNARRSGRDAVRKANIKQINTAIQLYLNENGHAPFLYATDPCSGTRGKAGAATFGGNCTAVDVDPTSWSALQTNLSAYLQKLPLDPCGVKCHGEGYPWYTYVYNSPGQIGSACYNQPVPECSLTGSEIDQTYQLYAETLEKSLGGFGINYSSFSSF